MSHRTPREAWSVTFLSWIPAAAGLACLAAGLTGCPTARDLPAEAIPLPPTEQPPQPVDAALPMPSPMDARPAEPASPLPPAHPDAGPPMDADGDAGRGGADAPRPAPDARMDTLPAEPSCTDIDSCGRGLNCRAGRCAPATVSCGAEKSESPGAKDGVYWINPGGVPLRAFCDMREKVELCTELEGEHRGVLRDPSQLPFRLISVLDARAGTCKVWGLRSSVMGYPIGLFAHGDPPTTEDTCAILGFVSTADLGTCRFGSDPGHSDCGYPESNFLRWGTICAGCAQNGGAFDHYVLQGPVHAGTIVSNAFGDIATVCRVR